MPARRPAFLALVLGLCVLAAWRAACVTAGPDIDTDAYAHHMIARAILASPGDLSVHWVWLPLFHYLQVPLVAAGGTMNDVRWANVVLAAVTPWVLYEYVRRTARSERSGWPAEATALLAALFAAACPIAMQMGTTAQPEPLFALLVLVVAIAFERGHYKVAAVGLSAAVLLRYEAWAALGAVTLCLVVDSVRGRRQGVTTAQAAPLARRWLVLVAPAAFILVWAALRRPVDGRWFGFLRDTHEFATDALHAKSPLDRPWAALVVDALDYPVRVPIRVLGPAMALVPFGVARTVRQQGARFTLVFAACLGFVSLTWVLRATLGLDRHFVCIVPLYATFAAQGAAVLADGVAALITRLPRATRGPQASADRAALAGRIAGGVAGAATLSGLGVVLGVWMGFWRASIVHGWPDREAVGAYLRALPGDPLIFCDEATVEILSGIDRRHFDRHWLDDPHTWTLVDAAARQHGVAYVATWRRKLDAHARATADVVMQVGAVAGDDSSGFDVIRVRPDAGGAVR